MNETTRVLVVDDNEALRENLAECLVDEGYDVSAAEDGAEALALLERGPPPAIVVLDLVMPGIGGRDLVARIREDPRLREVRVIVTSGLASAAGATETGADAFLAKPFGLDDLLEALRAVEA